MGLLSMPQCKLKIPGLSEACERDATGYSNRVCRHWFVNKDPYFDRDDDSLVWSSNNKKRTNWTLRSNFRAVFRSSAMVIFLAHFSLDPCGIVTHFAASAWSVATTFLVCCLFLDKRKTSVRGWEWKIAIENTVSGQINETAPNTFPWKAATLKLPSSQEEIYYEKMMYPWMQIFSKKQKRISTLLSATFITKDFSCLTSLLTLKVWRPMYLNAPPHPSSLVGNGSLLLTQPIRANINLLQRLEFSFVVNAQSLKM